MAGYVIKDTMDAALSELACFAKEPNPEGRGYIQDAQNRLRNLIQKQKNLLSVSPMLQNLRSFIQTSKDRFDDVNTHLEILDYIETLEIVTGSFDEQWYTAQKRRRNKNRTGMLEEHQVVEIQQPQDDNVTVIGSSVDIAASLDKLDWSTHYS